MIPRTLLLAVGGLLLLTLQPSFVRGADPTHEEIQAAQQAGENWLALLDAGRFESAWAQRYGLANKLTTKEAWLKGTRTRRGLLGRVLSRQRHKDKFTHQLRGSVPDGDYELISFKTSFERKKNGFEVLTIARADTGWQVAGYAIH